MRPTVCLNMIVKDESPVIRRCLESVKPHIDHWVIVDTGSTDGTQDLVRELLADIPGTLYERPWKHFGHNRTEALELARGTADYTFIIDADDEFVAPDGMPELDPQVDAYDIVLEGTGISFPRTLVVSNRHAWRFVGVLHEYITTDGTTRRDALQGVRTHFGQDGAPVCRAGCRLDLGAVSLGKHGFRYGNSNYQMAILKGKSGGTPLSENAILNNMDSLI